MLIASRNTLLAAVLTATVLTATAQAPALTTYTAPDQSATAGVPSGWKVVSGSQTVIQMTGPQGEAVVLGNTLVAQNAPFQLGKRGANNTDLSMPYSDTLAQKLTLIMQQSAAMTGKSATQFVIASTTPLQLPAAIGQCARFVANFTNQQGQRKLLAVLCSLPLDAGGAYKNILLTASAPAASAATSAPIAQAIFQSYNIPPAWLQKKLAPHGTAPAISVGTPSPATNARDRATILGAAGTNNSVNCFSLGVLRQTPTYDLPKSCGGTKPD